MGRGYWRRPPTGWGSERAEGQGAGGSITEWLSVVAKLGSRPQAAHRERLKTRPQPRPAPLLALAAELKITARSPPADRDPNPSPDPSPTGRGAKPQLPIPQKKKKKERKGGAGGGERGGRAGGGGPGHMDVISPLRGRRAAPQRSAPARRPAGPRLPPFLPPSLLCARSLSRPRRMGPAPGPGASGRRAAGVP